MKQSAKMTLQICLVAVVLSLSSGVVISQTADGMTPAEETVCNDLSGAAFGLCNAYCEAMDCELLDDGLNETSPNASTVACLKVKNNFIKITGEVPPCDCPPDNGQLGCPCDNTNLFCTEGLVCDEVGTNTCVEPPPV